MESLEISEIHVYPVKSCGGMSLDQAVMTPKGAMADVGAPMHSLE